MKKLLGSILKLGMGEGVAKLAAFALYGYIARAFGVELLGLVALAQTVATYVMMGTDVGLKMIGARIVARDAGAATTLVPHVLKKRLTSCALCVGLASVYAFWGPVPAGGRWYVFGFALAVIPYAFSLDWLAWGLDHFGWMGAWRASVGLLFVVGAVVAIQATGATLLPITLANGASAVVGAVLLWAAWRFGWKAHGPQPKQEAAQIERQLRWGAVLPLGAATIVNQMFNNFDTVMLGAMATVAELGRYSAAYKILFVIFAGYYLVTNALFPKLSCMKAGRQTRQLLWYVLLGVSMLGGCVAAVIAMWAKPILTVIYGSDLHAVHLLRILCLAIPCDFCAAMMGTVLVSQGFDKTVLFSASTAAATDIAVNLWLIPRLGAAGAAWATLASYFVVLVVLGTSLLVQPVLSDSAPMPAHSGMVGTSA